MVVVAEVCSPLGAAPGIEFPSSDAAEDRGDEEDDGDQDQPGEHLQRRSGSTACSAAAPTAAAALAGIDARVSAAPAGTSALIGWSLRATTATLDEAENWLVGQLTFQNAD